MADKVDFIERISDDHDAFPADVDRRTAGDPSAPATMINSYAIAGALVGNALEWYDFALYGYFASEIGAAFFPPSKSDDGQLLRSFVVFGGAFLMRPLGGLFFGHQADKASGSRKSALLGSLIMIMLPTFLLGCLPTYEKIGSAAVIMLVIVRLIQGLAVGGQLVTCMTYLCEIAPRGRTGMYGSLAFFGCNFGVFLGNCTGALIHSTLSKEDLFSYGWRIPFLSSFIVGLIGFFLQRRAPPSPFSEKLPLAANEASTATFSPLKRLFKEQPRMLALTIAMCAFWPVGFYTVFVWFVEYESSIMQPPLPGSFWINAILLALNIACTPLFGRLSDKVGRVSVMTKGLALSAIFPLLFYMRLSLPNGAKPVLSLLAGSVLSVSLAAFSGPLPAFMVESFDPRVRVTALGIGYNVAQALLGGTAPLIATALAGTSVVISPSFYLILCACLSAIGLKCAKSAQHVSRDIEMHSSAIQEVTVAGEGENIALI